MSTNGISRPSSSGIRNRPARCNVCVNMTASVFLKPSVLKLP